jgi:hypothetical protein
MSKPDESSITAEAIPSLADLDRAIEAVGGLSAVRCRDLRSAVARVASLLGEMPEHVPLDMQHIAARLAAVNAVAAGISRKTLSNIRSDFLAAARESGLQPALPVRKSELTPDWERMLSAADAKRYRIGLARFGRYASAAGMRPTAVDDRVLEAFIADIRRGSLHQNPNVLHRHVAVIWNELAGHFPSSG